MEELTSRVVRSEEEWKKIFEAQGMSRRSAAGFCREHGIDYNQFLYHRRSIRTGSMKALTVSRAGVVMPAARERGFIPVRVEGSCGMRLRFPRGLVLEADRILSAEWVVDVARRWLGGEVAPC